METQTFTAPKTNFETQASPELLNLAERIGEFIHYWGFKNVHGRIWTHLYLSERPLDAGDLVKRLKVSKALISMSLKELTKFKVIVPAGRSSVGTQLYDANPDVSGVIFHVLRTRESKLVDRVKKAFDQLGGTENSARAASLSALIEMGRQTLDGILATEPVPSNS